ncbi:hypothetical protein [Oceanirhabdus sp. W0125-5]|uniref:hypothetical protein n=1 Tax=Oceanirhabdus sp. W0125-5 TaxID=2999116 RepID=UPI0022F2E34E|nr:hypothetical protein [Oceanirhabdus sp. W0125-5]WBW99084.1 hypothetical protein OW730_10155 [Oceanirhabdus sp. W0125-5]
MITTGILSKVEVNSSNKEIVHGFKWAKLQALEYVRFGDPVGAWYEAALPERDAFCMRDTAHQSTGAQILGLQVHTKNMLKKFAANISESRDWCSYWEINKDDLPAPVDYKSDEIFWYNLPANFDVLDCCYRQYLWTGDEDYIQDSIFLNFYKRTVEEYVKSWDINNDGIMEHKGECPYRGIPSYLEFQVGEYGILAASDQIAAQYAGYHAYSKIQSLRNNFLEANEYEKKAKVMKRIYNSLWWSKRDKNFYTFILENGNFFGTSLKDAWKNPNVVTPMPLYFNLPERGLKTECAIKVLLECRNINVETKSHYPEVLYKYGYKEQAFEVLKELMSPLLKRREYPEVSFSVVGSIITGMMGVNPDATRKVIETTPRLTDEVDWITIDNIPVFENEISLRYNKNKEAVLRNISGDTLYWKAAFENDVQELIVDDIKVKTKKEIKIDGLKYSYVEIPVGRGEEHVIKTI